MASTAVRTWGTAVIRMTAMDSESARIRGSTAGPGSPGMRTSSNATSTRRLRMMSRPLAPSAASRTSKSSLRMKRSESRTPGSSSMTRTTGRGGYTRGGSVPAAASSLLSLGLGDTKDDILVPASATCEIDGAGLPRLDRGDEPSEGVDILHRLPIDLEDGIARPDARLLPGAAGGDIGDDDTRPGREPESLARLGRQGLDDEAERFRRRLCSDSLVGRLLSDLDREPRGGLLTDHDERGRLPWLHPRHALLQVRHVLDGRAVELHDDVAGFEARGLGRAVLHHVGDEDSAVLFHPEALGQLRCQLLDHDAQPPAHDPALGHELGHDLPRHVDRDREPDALPRGHHGRIDPDHLTLDVQQRTTGIARIDRGIGLDERLVGSHSDLGAAGGGDVTDRDGAIEAERVADGD